jgi:proton glutamate symport protein
MWRKGLRTSLLHLRTKLWLKVLIALGLGSIFGFLVGPETALVSEPVSKIIIDWIALPGRLFLQMIKMMIIPLIFCSIVLGIASSGNPDFIKKFGPRLLIYFILSTTVAIAIGFSVAFTFNPGDYAHIEVDRSQLTNVQNGSSRGDTFNLPDLIVRLIPENPLRSMLEGDMLGVVIFAIFLGIAVLMLKADLRNQLLMFLKGFQDIALTIVNWAMKLIPFAVFGLIAQVMAKSGIQVLSSLGIYVLVVLAGLAILLSVYMLFVKFVIKVPLRFFLTGIRDAQLLAFSTASSAAAMPVTLKVAEQNLKIHPAIAKFLIPVGATINMDGTALYQAVATVFLAQLYGLDLTFSQLLMVAIITVGASIGTPSAPGMGIIVLSTILVTVGIPASSIAIVIGVDMLLGMCRAMVNITGDLTACLFFDRKMGKDFVSDLPVENAVL